MKIKEYNFRKEKEVKKITDELFCKDVKGIIDSFLFIKCFECLKEGLEEYMYECYNNKYYCINCVVQDNIRKCSSCHKRYNCREYHSSCPFCVFSCYIYCPKCCIEKYKSFETATYSYQEDYTEPEWRHLNYFWLNTSNESKTALYQRFLIRLDELDNIDNLS